MAESSTPYETGVRLYEAGLPYASFEYLERAVTRGLVADLSRVRALNVLALCARQLQRTDRALELLNWAVIEAGRIDIGWLVRSLVNRSMILHDLNRSEEALLSAFQAAQMVNDSLGTHVVAGVYHTLGYILVRTQRYEEAITHLHEAWQAAQQRNLTARMAGIANVLGAACAACGRLDSGKLWFDLALEHARTSGDWQTLAYTHTELGRIALQEGRLSEAAQAGILAMQQLWLHVDAAAKEEIARICELLGMVAGLAGQSRMAQNLLHRAVAYYGQLGLWREWETVGNTLKQGLAKAETEIPLPLTELRQLEYLTAALGLLDGIESLVPSLRNRGEQVTRYAMLLAGALEVDAATREGLGHAGRLADIGLTILGPFEVKREHLTPNYELHPVLGEKWLRDFPVPPTALGIVRHHHEAWNGSGFPDGLKADAIPIGARILAACDGYIRVAETEGHSAAMQHLEAQSGQQYDPDVIDMFLQLHS